MHEVLVNRLGGLSLPRKSVVRLTDRPDMTLDVYRGRKTTIQQQQYLVILSSKTYVKVFSVVANYFTVKSTDIFRSTNINKTIYWQESLMMFSSCYTRGYQRYSPAGISTRLLTIVSTPLLLSSDRAVIEGPSNQAPAALK